MPPEDDFRSDLTYRTISVRADGPGSIDAEHRSVEAVGATEDPVEVFDYERYAVVPEILLMSGCRLPESRQVPLLDTHMRYAANDVIGSYREMRLDSDKLMGRAFFSEAPEAAGPWTRLREGHLTDFSVGYRVHSSAWIPENEQQNIGGREYTGPLRVVTQWTPRELSVCPIGADQRAKARSLTNIQKEQDMDKLREFLVSLGMPADANDEKLRAFQDTVRQRAVEKQAEKPDPPEPVDPEKARADGARAERERIGEIDGMCRTWSVPEEMARKLVDEGKSVDAARADVMDWLKKNTSDPHPPAHGGRALLVTDEKDKFRAAAEGAVLIRAGVPGEHDKIPGATDLAGYSLRELARHSLVLAGRPHTGSPLEMVGRALTTSDFPYILANVAHKSLFTGWESAEETWREWCDTGTVSDFKTHYSPRISEFSDLDEVGEAEEYKYGARTEAQESYTIVTYGKKALISRQAIINDDLGAITRNFVGMGEAAARKIGDLPYAVLTANADMGDGNALFEATYHKNYVSSGGAPGVATLTAGFLAMGTQKDLAGKRKLNIRPRFFLAPLALMGTAEIFFRSERFSDEDITANDSSMASTRVNIYSGDVLRRIYESRLDDDDAAAWYLAANKGKTVTVFFLNGVQAPYMEQQQGWDVDGTEFKVRIDAGAKAMDWRGLYLNMGD